jgi:hypothetical protein
VLFSFDPFNSSTPSTLFFDSRLMGRKRAGQPRSVRTTVAGKFGQRLEQLAAAAGLTTAEFSRKAGVTEDAINKYFRGTDVPRLDRWPRIARALGLKNAKDLLPDIPVE